MARDALTSIDPYFEEVVVFETIGIARRVPKLGPNSFAGPIAEWARRRAKIFGDVIIPRMTMVDPLADRHTVGWIYRESTPEGSGEVTACHHIACDCMIDVEPAGHAESILDCDSVKRALDFRAREINTVFRIEGVLSTLLYVHDEKPHITPLGMDFLTRTIAYLLEQDRIHPNHWVANVVSGQHSVTLLANVVQLPPDTVRAGIKSLVEQGIAECDGEVVRLLHDTQSPKAT